MKNYSLLILGGCMVSGYKLPPTAALPVHIQRAFKKKQNIKIHITTDHSSSTLEQLGNAIQKQLAKRKYDLIILYFLNNQIIPFLGVENKFKQRGFLLVIYRKLRALFMTCIPKSWIGYARSFYGELPIEDYLQVLKHYLELIKNENPSAKMFLLTPIAPTSPYLHPVRERFISYKDAIIKLAEQYDGKAIDIFKPLGQYPPDHVYRADGFHLTRLGQEIVNQTLIEVLEREFAATGCKLLSKDDSTYKNCPQVSGNCRGNTDR